LKLNKIDYFNASVDKNFRDDRINSRTNGEYYEQLDLPYDMQKLDVSINKWIDDNDNYSYFHNFNKESYFRKILSNRWDIIVDESIKVGNHHFAITINLPTNYHNDENLFSYKDMDIESYNNKINDIFDIVTHYFTTTSFIFIVGEKNKKDVLHFHLLVGIRNFIDYNYCLKNNLSNNLKIDLGSGQFEMCDYDVKVQSLKSFKDIKNWAIYMYKDMYSWKFPAHLFSIENYYQSIFNSNIGNVTDFYLHLYFIFNSFRNKELNGVILDNINGVILKENVINQGTLINLIQYYLVLNQYYIYNESVYKKINNSIISYELVGELEKVLYNQFQENVVSFFNINFESYFNGFDFNYLLRTQFIKSKSIIQSIKDISTNKIKPDFSIIEFSNGVYFIKYDRFIFKSELNHNFNMCTIKYCNKNYHWIKRNEPKNWISGLLNALDISIQDFDNYKNMKKLDLICLYFINIFHKDIFNKKLTLLIFGDSNTGKTSLIVKPIINYLGVENVGNIVSTKNFKLQELEGKIVGILDEFKYTSNNSSDFLKLLSGENLIVEKKYSKEHISISGIPIIIVSNNVIQDKNDKINKAFFNRISSIEFLNPIKNVQDDLDFNQKIKEEEINIILYCNKIYFKGLKENKNKKIKKLGNKISNKKFLESLIIN
jgi:hypothetical protein